MLHGSGVDLYSRDGHIERDRSGRGKWVSAMSQLVMVSGGRHHSGTEWVATTPFTHHPFLFHPKEFLSSLGIVLPSFLITLKQNNALNYLLQKCDDESTVFVFCVRMCILSFALFNGFCHVQCLGTSQFSLFRQHRATVGLHKEVQCVLHTNGSMLKTKPSQGYWSLGIHILGSVSVIYRVVCTLP